FHASYRCLPGFVSATVTGFRPGSVVVNYEVNAGAASFSQIASSHKNLARLLDPFYHLNPTTFTTEITNQTNFTVSPVDIFEGDTVRLICEINSTSENVTWYHFDQTNLTSFQYSVEKNGTSRSILHIKNITMNDSGPYGCAFTRRSSGHTLIYKATKIISVSSLNITSNLNNISVTCNSQETGMTESNGPLLSCCIDRHLSSLTGDWKVIGEITMTGFTSFSENCTEYKLNVNKSLCEPEKSGTVTTYTCELQTGHGARRSQNISVTYLWAASVTISSSTSSTVSEGDSFKLKCESDMRNYYSVSWKIQSGNNIKTVDCGTCIKNNKSTVTSELTAENVTKDWNGTYICTFSYEHLEISANMTVEVISLPLKQNILRDPIEASIRCKVPQALHCCINANTMEDYDVMFVVQQKECRTEKKKEGDFFCYTSTYTELKCDGDRELTAYCKFINRVGREVYSENIKLNLIEDSKISCSDSLGIGKEGDTLMKGCNGSSSIDGFAQGNKTYECSNKQWKIKKDACLSVPISNLLTSAESLVKSPNPTANLPTYLEELKNQTEKELNTSSPANVGAIVTILDMVSSIPAYAEEPTIQNFLSTVDFIVANSTNETWENLNEEQTPQSSLLLNSVEKFTSNLHPVNNTIPSVSTNTLQLQGIVVTEGNVTDYSKKFQSTENLTVNVCIDRPGIQTLTQSSTIVSVMYSELGGILPRDKSEYVNGLLITTTISSNRRQDFNINMTFAKKILSLKMPRCVFWNFSLEHRAGWDTRGCTPTEEEDFVICSCNHLTSFSILMSSDISSQGIFEYYITYIGLAISILSLVACIIIESLVWKYVTNNTTSYMRHVCILNIATTLLIADIWFIVFSALNDQHQQMSRGICSVTTFFIHLFYLCVFFWMLSLGLILFYRLVFILHNTSKTAQKAMAFCLGYGCPFVIAVITIAITLPRNSYTRKDICWLNWDDSKALLAFIIPALIIVAMNVFITAVVIIKIQRPTIGDRSNRQERNSLFQIVKSVAILTPLLGLTWVFGLATIKNSHQVFHILFALLNASQGFSILVFGTIWDKKIQEALLKRNSMSKWSSQQTKSNSLILVTPMLAMSYPFSRTFNNLCGKTGKYRVSSSEPSSSSSENTSKSYSLLN
ncbi:AGRF5 protein, partial [Rhynochetos jubatus]|nr:AGRF5 protein [Rhynochetos jubatus]